MDTKTVTIPLSEYEALKEADEVLTRLYAAGVDNWEWYDDAVNDEDEEDDE